VEDQVTRENICSQYVNYAFYQNILLLEKNTQLKRKESMKVIVSVLELISLFNTLFIENRLELFLGEVIENEQAFASEKTKKKQLQ
jgi:hypothetical protein